MVKQDAEITLTLATSLNGGSTIDITLPYASFDLEADKPLVKQKTRYFPLRRAKDETQYTIGRVFLQEAFILVDYDHSSFSILQAQYTSGTPSRIVATDTTTGTDTTSSNNDSTSDDPALVKTTSQPSHGIGTGAIAGIAVGIVVLAVAAIGFCLWRRRLRRSKRVNNVQGKAELPGESKPRGLDEAFGEKRRPSHESARETKKGVTSVNIDEVPRTPLPAELEGTLEGRSTAETRNEHHYMAELPSPDLFRPELEDPGLALIRSELSTPEPPPSELSTSDPSLVPELTSPHMAHELPSSNRNSRGSPSPLGTPRSQPGPSASPQPLEGYSWGVPAPAMGSQVSPSLSALNSPTIPHPRLTESGPPTPGLLDLSERQPLMSKNQQQASRETRFIENLTTDPDMMTNEERQRREEARRVVVKQEVEKIEDRARSEGSK
ncbi:MAG: hypothetical protein Q9185_001866 [Variospora sp. 1 TL-2023]